MNIDQKIADFKEELALLMTKYGILSIRSSDGEFFLGFTRSGIGENTVVNNEKLIDRHVVIDIAQNPMHPNDE